MSDRLENTHLSTPLVSVLLVCYNQQALIGRALQGATMQQTDFPFEVVVGDDHSTDGTREVCEAQAQLHPNRIRLLPDEGRNIGLSHNMLRTLQVCRGQFIAYLEGDDYWTDPNKLQRQADILRHEQDVVLVHTNCELWDIETDSRTPNFIHFDGEQCVRELHGGIEGIEAEFVGHFRPIKTSTCMYRRAVMDEILCEDKEAYCRPEFPTQDFALFLDMAYHGRFAFIDEDTTVIGLHDSLSAAEDEPRLWHFRSGFYRLGCYYINKYHLSAETSRPWFRKELHWLLHHAVATPSRSAELHELLSLARQRGYRLPLTQRGLLLMARLRAGTRKRKL